MWIKICEWKRKNKNYLSQKSTEEIDEYSLNHQDYRGIPEESLLQKDQNKSIQLVLHRLPKSYQSVISLYYFDNLSYQQIADQLGIAKKTVESRLYRGKSLLKELWIKEGYDEL